MKTASENTFMIKDSLFLSLILIAASLGFVAHESIHVVWSNLTLFLDAGVRNPLSNIIYKVTNQSTPALTDLHCTANMLIHNQETTLGKYFYVFNHSNKLFYVFHLEILSVNDCSVLFRKGITVILS